MMRDEESSRAGRTRWILWQNKGEKVGQGGISVCRKRIHSEVNKRRETYLNWSRNFLEELSSLCVFDN